MASLVVLLLKHPLRTLRFSYTFVTLLVLALLRRVLLPSFPSYQAFRIQCHRAFLSATSTAFPDLARRLPVGELPAARSRQIYSDCAAYLIPGDRELDSFSSASPQQGGQKRCVALYAHGGGYARGEANMYVDYMERWVAVAKESGLDLVFLSVEYRIPALSTESPHPSQVRAFVSTYRKLLDDGFRSGDIVFMGDSAGGGLCVLSAIELPQLGLPQPAASVLISPWMDLAMSAFEGGNPAVESDYFVMANEAVPTLARQFAGSYGLDSPEVNPLYRPPEDICRAQSGS
ncbi:hypothetical protein NM208_g11986 [Fusarium decemcellulare]|uniref:Uncharacterized protein n=1 Tax=Fusarium decemcellulare TaxID=57161 RepID=A0ACC1RTS4_9HYPO|nr:hypothetical protein NM208_g11986 [Fusarium decemcellulare]